MFNIQWQVQGHQPEAVAKCPLIVRCTHIDWHQGADLDLVGIIPLLLQVVAKRPCGGGDQQIVDRAAQNLAHCLDIRQINLLRPGHPLGAGGLATQAAGGVITEGGDIAQLARQIAPGLEVIHRLGGMGDHFDIFGPEATGQLETGSHQTAALVAILLIFVIAVTQLLR